MSEEQFSQLLDFLSSLLENTSDIESAMAILQEMNTSLNSICTLLNDIGIILASILVLMLIWLGYRLFNWMF